MILLYETTCNCESLITWVGIIATLITISNIAIYIGYTKFYVKKKVTEAVENSKKELNEINSKFEKIIKENSRASRNLIFGNMAEKGDSIKAAIKFYELSLKDYKNIYDTVAIDVIEEYIKYLKKKHEIKD